MSNYYELWKYLDIDIDRHDELMAILPDFFKDVYLSQKNRPEGMNYFNLVVSSIHGLRPKELVELRNKGKKVVGTFCVYVPDELVFAANAVSIGLCGGSQFWVPDGEKVLPKNLCPLIKSFTGAKLSKTCPFFQCSDILIGETTCDGKKKVWEILNKSIEIYVMNLPQMKREQEYKEWENELNLLKNKLESLTGIKVSNDMLASSIKMINNKRKALKRLYELRKQNPVPISGKDVLLISQIAFYDDPERFTQKVNVLCDELDERIRKGEGVFEKDAKRILITGTPMALPNWKLHHIVETSGAAVVCEETCTGTRYFENLVNENGTTLDEMIKNLAERYLETNCACFTPNTKRIEDILRLINEYKVDGVIGYNLQFCTPYAVEYYNVKKALEEKNIPILLIESDYTENDTQQIKTRVEAFIEMLK
ncbi:MAG: double-cubane-cluster-containing anaerobic reductase [Thermoanaerobacteraceae bacterium]|nr:double-cubane-cluster-containing anaerobic reductase [Thermoanaerobacteraceae bacterium]